MNPNLSTNEEKSIIISTAISNSSRSTAGLAWLGLAEECRGADMVANKHQSVIANAVLHFTILVNNSGKKILSSGRTPEEGRKSIVPVTFVSGEMEMQFPSNFTCLAVYFDAC